MSDCAISVDKGLEKAAALGCDVVRGDSKTLLLDFDDEESYERFTSLRPQFQRFFGVDGIEGWASKSGYPKRHVLLRLSKPLGVAERLCLQAILGSDPRRELIGLMRHLDGQPEPSLLFKPKEKR